MEERSELSVVIDGKVYRLSGGSDIYLQKLASYVDGKIRELKKQPGYNKLSTEYRDILLARNGQKIGQISKIHWLYSFLPDCKSSLTNFNPNYS